MEIMKKQEGPPGGIDVEGLDMLERADEEIYPRGNMARVLELLGQAKELAREDTEDDPRLDEIKADAMIAANGNPTLRSMVAVNFADLYAERATRRASTA